MPPGPRTPSSPGYEWAREAATARGLELSGNHFEWLLWEQTAFPFSPVELTQKQILAFLDKVARRKERGVPRDVAPLEILEPVDTIPPSAGAGKAHPSKWDAPARQAIAEPGRYVPVRKPSTWSPKWMAKRYPELEITVRGELVYLRYTPAESDPSEPDPATVE